MPVAEAQRAGVAAIGRVNIGGFRSRSLCSGTLIAPDLVLTAAHCVVNPDTGLPFPIYRVQFVAGWHKGAHAGASKARRVWTDPGYPATRGETRIAELPAVARDLALIGLATPLTGPRPLAVSETSAISGPAALMGYRKDRPHVLSDHLGCTTSAPLGRVLRLDCPVLEGTSGAPVLKSRGDKWVIVGVVSARVATQDGGALAAAVDATILKDLLESARQ